MKGKTKFAFLMGTAFVMTLASCNFKSLSPKLESLDLSMNEYKLLVKDDSILENSDLQITGRLSDGKERAIPQSEVELFYVSEETGALYDMSHVLPDGGDYTIKARYAGLEASHTFMVDYEREFATELSYQEEDYIVMGEDSVPQVYVGLNSSRTLSFNVEPFGCTEKLQYRFGGASDRELAEVVMAGNGQLEVKSKGRAGEVFIYVSIQTSLSDILNEIVFRLIFGDVALDWVEVDGPTVTGVGGTVTLNLIPHPRHATEDIFVKDDLSNLWPGKVLATKKINNKKFEVTGLKPGTKIIEFCTVKTLAAQFGGGKVSKVVGDVDFLVQNHVKVDTQTKASYETYKGLDEYNARRALLAHGYEHYSHVSPYLSSDPRTATSDFDSNIHYEIKVVPVWLNDSDNFIGTAGNAEATKKAQLRVRRDLEASIFGTGSLTGWESVSSYLEKESKGEFKLKGSVSNWLKVNASYTDFNSTRAIDSFVTENFSNRNIPTLYVVAAPHSVLGSQTSLHTQTLYGVDGYFDVAYAWVSYDYMYTALKVNTNQGEMTFAKARTNHDYHYGDFKDVRLDAHKFVYGVSSLFGLPSLANPTDNKQYAGDFTMQDRSNIGGHDPLSMSLLNWTNPYVIDTHATNERIYLNDFQSTNDLIVIGDLSYGGDNPDMDVINTYFSRRPYFIIELFTPTGLNKLDSDRYLQYDEFNEHKSGIRIWYASPMLKVDEKVAFGGGVADFWDINYGAYGGLSGGFKHLENDIVFANSNLNNSNYYLQLVREDTELTSNEFYQFDFDAESDLFFQDGEYYMPAYSKQFTNNSSAYLNWSISVSEFYEYYDGRRTAIIDIKSVNLTQF